MYIWGIDPGLEGAIAVRDTCLRRVVAMLSMPVHELAKGKDKRREIALERLVVDVEFEFLALSLAPRRVYIERVGSSPQMGVSSAFNFGMGYGALRMLIAANKWPVEYVSPVVWKRALKVPAAKDDAIARASQLMPEDVEQWTPRRGIFNKAQASGRADAALLAYFGETREVIEVPVPRFVRRT